MPSTAFITTTLVSKKNGTISLLKLKEKAKKGRKVWA